MPIYEYECSKCGELFENMQKVSDPAPGCEACGSDQVQRVMSRTSFILKGSGWYITDYARKDNGNGNGNGNGTKTSKQTKTQESKSETKQDSKPASTPKGESAAKSSAA